MADRLRQHGLTCQCLLTQRSGGAEEIARRLVSSGEEVRLYACGGDGTLNEVVNGAAGFDNAAVTCIPIGTGNDFLKNLRSGRRQVYGRGKPLGRGGPSSGPYRLQRPPMSDHCLQRH